MEPVHMKQFAEFGGKCMRTRGPIRKIYQDESLKGLFEMIMTEIIVPGVQPETRRTKY
jgi:hypothetical protein